MKHVGRFFMAFFAIGVALFALSYFDFSVKGLLTSKPEGLLSSIPYRIIFYFHAFFGASALALGPWQFWPRLRSKRLKLHRRLGKLYVLACLLAGVAGLVIALFATGGWVASLGFVMLALSWLYTTTQAWRSIKAGKVTAHQYWMWRSYALTYAAVTLRLYIPIGIVAFGLDFETVYVPIAYLCWIPNLLLIELLIWRKTRGRAKASMAGA